MKAARLLKDAAALYDAPDNQLSAKAHATYGFAGGAEWMRLALGIIRGCPPKGGGGVSFPWMGFAKYALAFLAFLLVWAAGLAIGLAWWLPAPFCVAAFYAVEVQFVFLFPLALDGSRRPWRASLEMTRRMGTLPAMGCVLPLAAVMLGGGLLGRGFVRCWCLGCLSVVLWYEEQRAAQRQIQVRVERVEGSLPLRLLWVTDLHLSRANSATLAAMLTRTARRTNPHIIVLGGDLIESAAVIRHFQRLLRLLSRIAPTHVLPGNHDEWLGLDIVRTAVNATPASWHDAPGFAIRPNGTKPEPIEWRDLQDPRESLVFVHDPKHLHDLTPGWRTAFAGHLHGGQVVLWRWRGLEYPGAWLSKWNGPRFDRSHQTVIVSRGVTDTLPIRWNCPREVILCEVC